MFTKLIHHKPMTVKQIFGWSLSTALLLSTFGCMQDDISDRINTGDANDRDKRNVIVRYNAYIEDQVINRETLYTNIFGEGFMLEEVEFLITNFRYISQNGEDTIWMDLENHAFFNIDDKSTKIGKLPQGNYNGRIYFDIGVNDSLHAILKGDTNSIFMADSLFIVDEPSFLANNLLWNIDTIGYLMCRIRGQVYDTLFGHPDTTTSFSMLVGGPAHFIEMSAEANFSINVASEIVYILDWDIDEVFNIYPLLSFPEMGSSMFNATQFQTSGIIRDTLDGSYFLR